MFQGAFTMNDPCPVCGLVFQREEGYFLGAMYASYLIGCVILTPFYFLLAGLFPTWSNAAVITALIVPYMLITPAVFRYSRVLWVYFDRAVDPSEINDCVYEKVQRRKQETEKSGPPAEQGPGRVV